MLPMHWANPIYTPPLSSVQDVTYALCKSHIHSTPQFSSRCYLCAGQIPYTLHPSVQFKMLPMRWANPIYTPPLSSVQFKMLPMHWANPIYTPPLSSVQDVTYALGKSHIHSTLQFSSRCYLCTRQIPYTLHPSVQFKMLPMRWANPIYTPPLSSVQDVTYALGKSHIHSTPQFSSRCYLCAGQIPYTLHPSVQFKMLPMRWLPMQIPYTLHPSVQFKMLPMRWANPIYTPPLSSVQDVPPLSSVQDVTYALGKSHIHSTPQFSSRCYLCAGQIPYTLHPSVQFKMLPMRWANPIYTPPLSSVQDVTYALGKSHIHSTPQFSSRCYLCAGQIPYTLHPSVQFKMLPMRWANPIYTPPLSSVQDVTYALGKSHIHSTPQFSSRCYLCAGQIPYTLHPSVQFKMLPMRWANPIYTPPLSSVQDVIYALGKSHIHSTPQFSSVQDVTYALGKSHIHSTPQFSSRCYLCAGQIPYTLHPSVQFKMLSMRWANPIYTPPLSSVQDVTYALGKSHIHSTPQFSSRCYLCTGQIPYTLHPSVQFKMLPMRWANPIYTPPLSSVQDVIYALGKSHIHSTLQFSSRCYLCTGQIPYTLHPSVQFKMLPMRWANPIYTPPLSSVQDVTYALGKSHIHSTPQFSSRCYLCAGQIPYTLHPSVQFKMLPMRWANPIYTPPLSSVQDVIYALGKSHIHSSPLLEVSPMLPLKQFQCSSD